MKISGHKAFLTWKALRAHFYSDYSYIKYNGKTRDDKTPWDVNPKRFVFEKAANKYEFEEFKEYCIANLIVDKNFGFPPQNILSEESKTIHMRYQKRKQTFSYAFSEDIDRALQLVDTPKKLFKVPKNAYPKIMLMCCNGQISLETFVVLDDFIHFSEKFDKELDKDDIVWESMSRLTKKLRPFLRYDKGKIRSILEEKLLNRDS